jgi:nucleoside-diphosphate-sugar epimerase
LRKNILIIGGTRFFGRRLVRRLLDAGACVTIATRGRAADDFGERVSRIVVDRRDRAALQAAMAGRTFDVVFDQMCYTPLDARLAVDVFAGRVGRYVMASTIEVYQPLCGRHPGPFAESDLPGREEDALDHDSRWHDPAWAEARYGDGKRRAEAVLARDGRLAFVAARIGHVLGGPEDFTRRLAAHVRAARAGRPLVGGATGYGASSFIDPEGIAAFLQWVGEQGFVGTVNAACEGGLDAAALHRFVESTLNLSPSKADGALAWRSPFSYAAPFEMDLSRARALGHGFGPVDAWLPETIRSLAMAPECAP